MTDKDKIPVVCNDLHELHNIHAKGYPETPDRLNAILKKIENDSLFEIIKPQHFGERYIQAVHDKSLINYFKKMSEAGASERALFPRRNFSRYPEDLSLRLGSFCFNSDTPLNKNALIAARRAVDCTLTAAKKLTAGYSIAYALVRPPGHHAERSSFGGFCYFNSTAIAAQYLSIFGSVAVLDVDYHHGNGGQDIFYGRSDILTVSIHAHPRFAYPYFSGFEDEKGYGEGRGYNRNIPLPEKVDGTVYRAALDSALSSIVRFRPEFLVVAFGLDTGKGDPIGTWSLNENDFYENGRMIGALKIPAVVVQEGGYNISALGEYARQFFCGLVSALQT